MAHTRNRRHDAPRLVPTGNVDDALLTGRSRGKTLTLFQSIGLAVFGVCVVVGIGVSAIAGQFMLRAKFERLNLVYPGFFEGILFGSLMCLLGGAWIVMGLFGVYKIVRRKK
jgi:hypothetical protein